MASEASTPLSQSTTLTNPSERFNVIKNGSHTTLPAYKILENVATESSSAVFIYDLAADVGLGGTSKEFAKEKHINTLVYDLQTRSGAGLLLAGRLSEGTSIEGAKGGILSAYTTPIGLSHMISSFEQLPKPKSTSRLVTHVARASPLDSTFELSPSLAPVAENLWNVSENFSIIFSATAQETVDLTTASYSIANAHVIHFFDQSFSAREITELQIPRLPLNPPVLDTFTAIKKAGYNLVDFYGASDAESVIVVVNGPLALALQSIVDTVPSLGVLVVRVLRPWDDAAFLQALPSSVKTLHVVEDGHSGSSSNLFYDVLGTSTQSKRGHHQHKSHVVHPNDLGPLISAASSLVGFISSIIPINWFAPPQLESPHNAKKIVFFGNPSAPTAAVPALSASPFLTNPGIFARLLPQIDIFSKPGGVLKDVLLLASRKGSPSLAPIISGAGTGPDVDFTVILDHALLKTHDILSEAKEGSGVLVFTSWSPEETTANLSPTSINIIASRKLQLFSIDVAAVARSLENVSLEGVIGALAFLRLYLGPLGKEKVLLNVAQAIFGENISSVTTEGVAKSVLQHLKAFRLPEESISQDLTAMDDNPKPFSFNSISSDIAIPEGGGAASLGTWAEAAKHILFREAYAIQHDSTASLEEYSQNPRLRPDVPERTFLVTCTVNRRLTPIDYDRNVFHLEFDTSGTGLKYAIGEALGVHGWNDDQEVLDFCSWYGIDVNKVISIPVPGEPTKRHTRTVFQAFQQQIDLFGKPPKSFYEALSGYASTKEDRMALRFISAAEGSSTFKKLSELETVTFADVLRKFTSAKPPVEVLAELIGDIKPRHYSIASAQSAVGDRVDLLVVTVNWTTPSGSPRYGQCTRYLAALKVGQKVTVSIKPSVMKLPPSDLQPIIMAGLGTGAAPFRAFMQHRALLAAQSIPVGPMVYYFGSRHRYEEYLYGEEIEAYLLEGVITHAGLAFSRDEKRKVYIQHKMQNDGEMLAGMLGKAKDQRGVFYLCGPTWPVPDVFEAIVNSLVKHEGIERKEAEDYIEGLKEEERYVLEVY